MSAIVPARGNGEGVDGDEAPQPASNPLAAINSATNIRVQSVIAVYGATIQGSAAACVCGMVHVAQEGLEPGGNADPEDVSRGLALRTGPWFPCQTNAEMCGRRFVLASERHVLEDNDCWTRRTTPRLMSGPRACSPHYWRGGTYICRFVPKKKPRYGFGCRYRLRATLTCAASPDARTRL